MSGTQSGQASQPNMSDGVWRAGADDFAVRIEARDVDGRLVKEIIVEPGQQLLLLEDGRALKGTMGPGRYPLSRVLDPGAPRRTAWLVVDGPVVLDFPLENLHTADNIRVGGVCKLTIGIANPTVFFAQVMRGRSRFLRDDLRDLLFDQVRDGVQDFVRECKLPIETSAGNKQRVKTAILAHLEQTLQESGITLGEVRTYKFTNKDWEDTRDKEGEVVLRRLAKQVDSELAELNASGEVETSSEPLEQQRREAAARKAAEEEAQREAAETAEAVRKKAEAEKRQRQEAAAGKAAEEKAQREAAEAARKKAERQKKAEAAQRRAEEEAKRRAEEAKKQTPVWQQIGIEMVTIPAGEFLMGSDSGRDSQAYKDEKPQHRVKLAAYQLAYSPVTVAQFAAFVETTGYRTTAEEKGSGWLWKGKWEAVKGAEWRHPQGPGSDVSNKAGHPVTQISWHDAVAFCRWAGLRLPSEAEWEKGARGTDGRLYPWGNEAPDDKRCNYNMNVKDTTAVGNYPAGASPYGLLDMAGNVWEWTSSLKKDYPYRADDGREDEQADGGRVLRGGSWFLDSRGVRSAFRLRLDPDDRSAFYGFRCARSL